MFWPFRPRRKHAAPTQRLRRYRPVVEGLEERLAPAFDLLISTAPTNTAVSKVTDNGLTTFTAIGTGANLSGNDVMAELNAGNNVLVTSGTGGNEAGSITLTAGISFTGPAPRSLTLVSGSNSTQGDILLNARVLMTRQQPNVFPQPKFEALALRHVQVGNGITLSADDLILHADVKADGSGDDGVGTISVGAQARLGGRVHLRGADIEIDTSPAPPCVAPCVGPPEEVVVATAVDIRSSLGSRPMSIGGSNSAVAGINLTDAELARLVPPPFVCSPDACHAAQGPPISFGDGLQTGDIRLVTVAMGTPQISVHQAASGGRIILDDEGNGVALYGSGSIVLDAGPGGIVAASASANGHAELLSTGHHIQLLTLGSIGSGSSPIEFLDDANVPRVIVNIGGGQFPPHGEPAPSAQGAFLRSIGHIMLGDIHVQHLEVDVGGGVILVGAFRVGGGGTPGFGIPVIPTVIRIGRNTDYQSYAEIRDSFSSFGSPIHIEGRAGDTDTFRGPNTRQGYYLAGPGRGSGAGVGFSEFEHLLGGAADDEFVVGQAGSIDHIDGRGGVDTLLFDSFVDATHYVSGPGSLDGYQGRAVRVSSFDNLNLGRGLAAGAATPSGEVFVRRLDLAGNPLGDFLPSAPGAFTKVVTFGFGVFQTMVFGLSVDHQVYWATFDLQGRLQVGWVSTGAGTFTDIAVTAYDHFNRAMPILFGLGSDRQIYATAFSQSTSSQDPAVLRPWFLVAPGQFTSLAAGYSGSAPRTGPPFRDPIVFGVGLDHQVYAARFGDSGVGEPALRYGFFHVAPGAFSKVTVGQRTDGVLELFGLGLDQQVYAAKFGPYQELDYGWFLTAPGTFRDIAAAPISAAEAGRVLLAVDTNPRGAPVFGALFDASGALDQGWFALTPGVFARIGTHLFGKTLVLGIPVSQEDTPEDALTTDVFTEPPGPFHSLALSV